MSVIATKNMIRVQIKDSTSTWNTVSDGCLGFSMPRHRDKVGVLQVNFWDVNNVGLDPSKNPSGTHKVIKGQKIRVQSSSNGSTWVDEYNGTIRKVDVDPKSLRGTKRLIKVTAGNGIQDLVAGSGGIGAGITDDLRYTLTQSGSGVSFNVNGVTSALASPASTTFPSDNNNDWELTLITKDSQDLFVWMDKSEVLQVQDAAHKSTSTVATFTSTDYSDVSLDYTIEDILNDVSGWSRKKGANGKVKTQFVYRKQDATSITNNGRYKAKYVFHGLSDSQIQTKVDNIVATNKSPSIVPTGCTVPINSTSDITTFVQGIDLNDKVSITDPDGTTYSVRVASINHTVTPNSWTVRYGFVNPTLIARPRRTSTTGVANVTDAQVETSQLNDLSVTTSKLVDGAVTAAKANTTFFTDIGGHGFTTSGTAPSSPATGDYWVDTANGNVLKRWNGTSWVSIQDAAIATAQTTANGKNTIFTQGTTPTATRTNDQWIDTANGNVIKIWNGTAWVSVQDTAIAAAQSTATAAQTTANGKNKVTYSTSTPGSTANTAGDIWFQTSGATIIGQWQGNGGTSWTSVTLTNAVISTLDAAKITTGTLDANRIGADTITADKLLIGVGHNLIANPGFESGATAPHVLINASSIGMSGTVHSGSKAASVAFPTTIPNGSYSNAVAFNGALGSTFGSPVALGDVVHAEIWTRVNSASNAKCAVAIVAMDQTGAVVSTNQGNIVTVTSTYQKSSVDYTVPTGVAFVQAIYQMGNIITAGTSCFIDDMYLTIKTQGYLIVDGSITATQIAAGTITSNEIAANTITAGDIAAGTITSNELAANSVIAAKIAAGAIDGMTITGPVIQTATSGARMSIQNDTSGGVIKFYSGLSGETPGFINPGVDSISGTYPTLDFKTATTATATRAAEFYLISGSSVSPGGFQFYIPTGGNFNVGPTSSPSALQLTDSGNLGVVGNVSGAKIFAINPTTTTGTANTKWVSGGQFQVISSLSKYKIDQKPITMDDAKGLLKVEPKTWFDKGEVEAAGTTKGLDRIPGLIAEDVEAHAPIFAEYRDGELAGVAYDRIPAALLVIVKDQDKRIAELEAEVKRLKSS